MKLGVKFFHNVHTVHTALGIVEKLEEEELVSKVLEKVTEYVNDYSELIYAVYILGAHLGGRVMLASTTP